VTLELFTAAVMLGGLTVYALTGGADYGGGVWDLLARGPRAAQQREAIEHALAPVWEANHVWLIFVIVVMFTAFPVAFARIGIELVAPLTLLLFGIVLRGSAFVFRRYGGQPRWGTVFAISSVGAPIFLGIVLGAITSGPPWWGAFPLAVGALALAAFAFLAAAYLTLEATEEALREDFRRRCFDAAIAVAITATFAAVVAHWQAPRFSAAMFASWWTVLLVAGGALALLAAVAFSRRKHDHAARAAAIVTVALLVIGWGAAQVPIVVAPDLTIHNAAAPHATLRALAFVIITGAIVGVPSLAWLLRVFKTTRAARS
jgi:cytochrome d ubiquinol oxidase subunit II